MPVAEAGFAHVVTNPSKIICVGLNYRTHIKETGRELPGYPTLFAKFAETLTGPNDDLALPAVSEKVGRGWRRVIQVSCETGEAPARRGSV